MATLPRIALATCAAVIGRNPEDKLLMEALTRRGVRAVSAVWDSPEVDWAAFDLVVVRSTWDYPEQHAAFLAWAHRLPKVLNHPSVLRWNIDKRYLAQLADAGLPVVPTRFLEPGDSFELPAIPFIVKPAISCAAQHTARYEPGDVAAARDHVQRLQRQGRTVMVQPYLAAIDDEGETALVYFEGTYSHAIRRGPGLHHGRASAKARSPQPHIHAWEATPADRALAERVLGHVPSGPAALAYARVDLVTGAGQERLILEVELTEPSLFLEYSDGSAERFAACLATHLRA